jgi:7,8-dihydroneopterin aldolase/epimerase/oxygenase
MTTKSSLFINALELELFLGWPNEERIRQQIVTLDVEIQYSSPPKACSSDHLQDTVCYRELIEMLRAKVGSKHYHLIEHVTQEVYTALKTVLPSSCHLSVHLTKHPQIQGLGSVTFSYHDEVISA